VGAQGGGLDESDEFLRLASDFREFAPPIVG
jgi:hypothetical protein